MKWLIGLLLAPFMLVILVIAGVAGYFAYDRLQSYAPVQGTVVAVQEGCRRNVPFSEHVEIFRQNWRRPTVGFMGAVTLMGISEVLPCNLVERAQQTMPQLKDATFQRYALVRVRYQSASSTRSGVTIGTLELAIGKDEPLPVIGSERMVRARVKPPANTLIAFILYRWNHGNLLPV